MDVENPFSVTDQIDGGMDYLYIEILCPPFCELIKSHSCFIEILRQHNIVHHLVYLL